MLNVQLPHDAAIVLLSTDPKETNTATQTANSTPMFTEALSVIGKRWGGGAGDAQGCTEG